VKTCLIPVGFRFGAVVRMKYSKPPLSFESQADLLIARGLVAYRTKLISRLEVVNYYRLSGYLYPFRNLDDSHHSRLWNRELGNKPEQYKLFILTAGLKPVIFKITVPATLRALRSTADQGGASFLYPSLLSNQLKISGVLWAFSGATHE
jgi:hypothetical protein